ncbi:MAG: helix-turn-helix transcriptional regulator [Bryobacteraceae bacterium]|jgi:DNA-binding XRE family transcriptional regulator
MIDRVNASDKLYNRIAVLRAEHRLGRDDLADALGVSYQTIGYMERGDYNPSLELAFRVAEFFNLPVEAVFSRKPFRPMSEELYGERATPPSQPVKPVRPDKEDAQ